MRKEYVGYAVIERGLERGTFWVYERGFDEEQCPEWFDAPRLFASKAKALSYAYERFV